MTSIIVVEDDAVLRASLTATLCSAGFSADAFAGAEDVEHRILFDGHEPIDLLILDVRLGGMSGVELVELAAEAERLPPTLMISGAATAAEAARAVRLGVLDYLEKPFTEERLLQSVQLVLRLAGLERQVAELEPGGDPLDRLLGESECMMQLKTTVRRLAATDARAMILGESGVGKELVAEALHYGSDRSDGPFLRLNCAALSSQLVESELFGHVAGAFTDARSDRVGLFESADGGTLFLDEIGDMQTDLQSKLLRVLEEGVVRRVGDNKDRSVDVRVIAATHRDVKEHSDFRQDLYYRLCHVPIEVPALRRRVEDVPLLTEHFLTYFARRHRRPKPTLTGDALLGLQRHGWPGNVRELRSVCERMVILGDGEVDADQLALDGSKEPIDAGRSWVAPGLTLREARRQFEREYVLGALTRAEWNVSAAARILGVRRTYLHAKTNQLGIQRPRAGSAETEPNDG